MDEKKRLVYMERASWPVGLWFFLIFMVASLALAVWAALGDFWAVSILTLLFSTLIISSKKSLLTVAVDSENLRAGDARISRKYIKSAVILSREELRLKLGPEADPSAFLATRFWIHTGVLVIIEDPQDRTPYWIVSSKKAQSLATALNASSSEDLN
jgi:hypothetical protein